LAVYYGISARGLAFLARPDVTSQYHILCVGLSSAACCTVSSMLLVLCRAPQCWHAVLRQIEVTMHEPANYGRCLQPCPDCQRIQTSCCRGTSASILTCHFCGARLFYERSTRGLCGFNLLPALLLVQCLMCCLYLQDITIFLGKSVIILHCQMGSRRMHTSLQQNDGHSSARRKSDYVCSKMCNSPNPFCHHHIYRPCLLRPMRR